jgi:hypothetical protein
MLKIIGTFILIYLIFRVFTYYILPWIMRMYIKSFKKKFYEQNPHLRPDEPQKKGKSKVNIKFNRSAQKSGIDKDFGDYIDFEEIKEDKKNKKS